jgi:hypothetical protein
MIQMRSKRIIDEYHGFSFSRSSMAQDQKGKLYYPHNARFLPGKFGQAVLVEEGTANLWSKGNPETWEGYSITGSPSDHYSAQIVEFQGRTCLKVHIVSAGDGTQDDWRGCYILHRFTAVTGDTYTQQCEIYVEPGGRHQGSISKPQLSGEYTLSGVTTGYDLNQVGTWQKLIRNSTANADGKGNLNIYLFSAGAGAVYDADYTVYLYHPQIEKLPYSTTFITGTRAADNLSISPDVINLAEGEIELTVIPQIIPGIHIHFEANAGRDNKNQFMIWKENVYWRVGLMDKDGTIRYININYDGQVGVPTDFKLKWRNINSGSADAEVKAIMNGVEKGHITGVQIDMDPLTVAYIGRRATSESYYGDALYDDLRISSIYRSDEDDIAAYESNQPLPVDQYTTLKLGFDGPDGQRGAAIVTL